MGDYPFDGVVQNGKYEGKYIYVGNDGKSLSINSEKNLLNLKKICN